MFLLNHFFRQSDLLKRFIYDYETPKPDIPEGEGTESLELELPAATIGTPLEGHHFENAKTRALNLLAQVDAALEGVENQGHQAQAKVLKDALAAKIREDFDGLHTGYQRELDTTIRREGETSSRAREIRDHFRKKAQEKIAEIEARVRPEKVQEHARFHGAIKALKDQTKPGPERTEALAQVLRNLLGFVNVPYEIRGLSKYMAEAMNEAEISRLTDNRRITNPQATLQDIQEAFKELIDKNDLVERAIKQLAQRIALIKSFGTEKEAFRAILKDTSLHEEGLERIFGDMYTENAVEALSMRFRTITFPAGKGRPDTLTYFIDLKNPGEVYTRETLKQAIKTIVENEIKNGEGQDIKKLLDAMKKQAEDLTKALYEVAEPEYLQGGSNVSWFNDMIDSLGELQGEDKEKLDQLVLILKHADLTDKSRFKELDRTERQRLGEERTLKAAEKAKEADRQTQVGEYAKERGYLITNVNLAEGLTFEPPTKDFAKAALNSVDTIQIKKGAQLVATIETVLKAPHVPKLTVYGPDGRTPVFTRENFKSMEALEAFLKSHLAVEKIPDEIREKNKELLNRFATDSNLWLLKGQKKLQIGSYLKLEDFPAIEAGVQPHEPFHVKIPIRTVKAPQEKIMEIHVEFDGAGNRTVYGLIWRSKDNPTRIPLADITQIRSWLEKEADGIAEARTKALENQKAAEKTMAAIALPKGAGFQWSEKPLSIPKDLLDPNETMVWTLHNQAGAEIGTVAINVVSRKITVRLPYLSSPVEKKDTTAAAAAQVIGDSKILEALQAIKPAPPPAPEKPAAGPAAEKPKLSAELEAARQPLITMLQKQFPEVFSETKVRTDQALQDAIAAILKNLQTNKPRLELLKQSQDFTPSDSERAMIMAEVEKSYGWEKLGWDNVQEVRLIKALKRLGDGLTFNDLMGEASGNLAAILSMQYQIKDHDKGFVLTDGKKEVAITQLEDLTKYLPKEYQANFKKLIDPNTKDEKEIEALQKALSEDSASRLAAIEQVRAIKEALRDAGFQEKLGKMSFLDALGSIMEVFQAIGSAMSANPPDWQVLKDALGVFKDGMARSPVEVRKKNERNFAEILKANTPAEPEKQPDYIANLLEGYLSPSKGGAADHLLLSPAALQRAGITDAQSQKDLELFRPQLQVAIKNHLQVQFGLEGIEKIEKDSTGPVARTKILCNRGGQKYEIQFYKEGGIFKAEVYKFHQEDAKDDDNKAYKKTVRNEKPEGEVIENANFQKVKAILEGKPPEKPEDKVKPLPATDAERKVYRDILKTPDEKVAFYAAYDSKYDDIVAKLRADYADLKPEERDKNREWVFVYKGLEKIPNFKSWDTLHREAALAK